MNIIDLIHRSPKPVPWEEGDNIPWHEPGFSARMLQEHLSQSHDAASRRFEIIDRHVEWIHTMLLTSRPSYVLDLACGPGLYAYRLARLGHTVHGIDYSPASIEYATSTCRRDGLTCTFVCQDIRQAVFPTGMDLVMLIYGEFNVFRPSDASQILDKAWQALAPGGILLLEPHTFRIVKHFGKESASWYSSRQGLFSPDPHLVLQENFWDERSKAVTRRYYCIDAQTAQVTCYAQSMQAYRNAEYRSRLTEHGFIAIQILPGLMTDAPHRGLIAIVAHKES